MHGIVDGKVLLDRGRMLTVVEKQLRSQAQEAVDRLRPKNAEAFARADRLTAYLQEACQITIRTPYPINRYATPIVTNDK